MEKLLSREQFKEAVFKRDRHKCVFCDLPAVDAHHIIDRSLWPNSGYYLSNGASVCKSHHWDCERTDISVEAVRQACGITNIIVPPGFDISCSYDKWGNPILANGKRLKGKIFHKENVQKIIKAHLGEFYD